MDDGGSREVILGLKVMSVQQTFPAFTSNGPNMFTLCTSLISLMSGETRRASEKKSGWSRAEEWGIIHCWSNITRQHRKLLCQNLSLSARFKRENTQTFNSTKYNVHLLLHYRCIAVLTQRYHRTELFCLLCNYFYI